MTFESMSKKELEELHSQLLEKYSSFKAKNLKLDMSRGKPCTQQLDLSMDMLKINDVKSSTGLECRNYGILDGIQLRQCFAAHQDTEGRYARKFGLIVLESLRPFVQ